MRRLFRKPITWVALSVVLAVLIVGLALFEPWRAFTSSEVDEPVPAAAADLSEQADGSAATPTDDADSGGSPTRPGSTSATPSKPEPPAVLANGRFVSQEHDTSGSARVLELADGSRVLRLEGFSTSDGPDVHVWLTDRDAGSQDWGIYDDGRYVALGEMKATDGNQNYLIPADADLAGLSSAVIWCDRFNVAFGSAQLDL